MYGDDVGDGPDLLEIELGDVEFGRGLRGEHGVEGDNVDTVGLHSGRDFTANPAETQHCKCLARQLVAGVELSIPSALLQGLPGLNDVSREDGN